MRTSGGMGLTHLVLGVIEVGLLAGPAHSDTVDRDGKLTLVLPQQPTADEMVVAHVTVGDLPPKARIVVRTGDGEIAGTITPYGVRPGQNAGVHTVAVPAKAVAKNKVALRFRSEERRVEKARGPSPTEIQDIKLVLIPAVRVDRDGKLTLVLPQQPTADEMVVAHVTVRDLPPKARIVVRTGDGEIAGTITPYGVRPGQNAGVHTVAVPAKAVAKNKVALRF